MKAVRMLAAAVLSVVLTCTLLVFVPPDVPAQSMDKVSWGNARLAVELYRTFARETDNFVFSPLSVYTLLGMLYGGAGGETADQIATILGIDPGNTAIHDWLTGRLASLRDSEEVDLVLANALWPAEQYPLLDEYLELIRRYDAEIMPLDYEGSPARARSIINNWAEEMTNHRIRNLLQQPPKRNTVLIAANAIYFKGDWHSQFDPDATTDQRFHGTEEGRRVPLMYQEQEFEFGEFDGVQVLEMPYAGNEIAMIVILPAEGHSLAEIEYSMTAEMLEHYMDDLWWSIVKTYLPRFSIRSDFFLESTLQNLGLTDLFVPGLADLSGIDGIPNWLYVGNAVQQAFIEVNEEGAEAAAVTAGGGCFPAGTPVLTLGGLVPIETVTPGTQVLSYHFEARDWRVSSVSSVSEHDNGKQAIGIVAGAGTVEATGNHPFFVVEGANLDRRPVPRDVPAAERSVIGTGRWVEADDLVPGDVLVAHSGLVRVSEIRSGRPAPLVYNLEMDGPHNYAVGPAGFLVHNKGSAEPQRAIFRADRPFIYLITERATRTILFMGRVANL